MGNKIFEALLIDKIEIFKNAFKNISKSIFYDDEKKMLRHAGEYGTFRENICKDFIRFLVPRRLNIDHGFVINSSDEISTQCDIIVYDYNSTPLIEDNEKQRFYPVETVVAIGEVKSKLSRAEFIKAINKLAEVKQMRDKIISPSFIRREHDGIYNPSAYPYDNLFTFLICEKLDFDLSSICNLINSEYQEHIKTHHKHNIILSIEDGLLLYNYYDENIKENKCLPWPFFVHGELKNAFIVAKDDNDHFKFFAQYLFMGTSCSSILYPEMAHYMLSVNKGELKLQTD